MAAANVNARRRVAPHSSARKVLRAPQILGQDVEMLAAAFALTLILQDPPPATAPEPYRPPRVRPFEPPSDFGRETVQGDGEARPYRAPVAAPVSVGAYAGQYEAQPTAQEAQYAQGVAAAELSTDALAGPLDGRWTLVDAHGGALVRLVLSDSGGEEPVEGAWRAARGAGRGVAASESRGAGAVDLVLQEGGRLSLTASADGWAGTLTGPDGRVQSVRLVR